MYLEKAMLHLVNIHSEYFFLHKLIKLNRFHIDVTGGPVKQHHKFLQFHMHWGKDAHSGSEHLVDGNSYPAEVRYFVDKKILK